MAVVLITGCSSGFGLASALAFARQGDTVYASMRSITKDGPLVDAAKTLDIHLVELDVTKSAGFQPCISKIIAEAGRLDVLVNNAGILYPGAFEDLSDVKLREVMETNFFGPMGLTRTVLPHMRAQRSGYIIMISSLSGVAGLPGDVAYTASKFAIEGATEALRHEVDRWGVRVALVEAGMYATRIFDTKTSKATGVASVSGSPYQGLIDYKMEEIRGKISQALDPDIVGQLLVRISRSSGQQLRWPADEIARKVLATMFGQGDAERDEFLTSVSGTQWWSDGSEPPSK